MNKFLMLMMFLYSGSCFAQETRKIIAIVDTGFRKTVENNKWLCESGHKDWTNSKEGMWDVHGHGTNVAGIIVKGLDYTKVCLVIHKYWLDGYLFQGGNTTRFFDALEYIHFNVKPTFINLSLGGAGLNPTERILIKDLIQDGTQVVVSAGNSGLDLDEKCDEFPACYGFDKNFYVVGNLFNDGKRVPSSNYGKAVRYWEYGMGQEGFGIKLSGTSQSAANFTNKLVKSYFNALFNR